LVAIVSIKIAILTMVAKMVEPVNKNSMKALLFALVLMHCISAHSQTVLSADSQLKLAVLAAPNELRGEAKVYGYNNSGDLVTLREGSNGLVCLADDPNQKDFSVSCYQKDLDVFMARGRELKKQGKSSKEVFAIREEEAKSGKITIPKGSMLYVYTASEENVNETTGEVSEGYLRYVVYLPFETSETTGLPTKPEFEGQPWIMDPGTHRAHIMLSPPNEN